MRRFLGVVALGVIVLIRLWPQPAGIPLFNLDTGVNVVRAHGHVLFVDKEGLNITVLDSRDPSGGALAWCVTEQVYLEPASGALYDASGLWVDGSKRPDMRTYSFTVDREFRLHLASKPNRIATDRGSISDATLQAYRVWQVNHGAHFCLQRITP